MILSGLCCSVTFARVRSPGHQHFEPLLGPAAVWPAVRGRRPQSSSKVSSVFFGFYSSCYSESRLWYAPCRPVWTMPPLPTSVLGFPYDRDVGLFRDQGLQM